MGFPLAALAASLISSGVNSMLNSAEREKQYDSTLGLMREQQGMALFQMREQARLNKELYNHEYKMESPFARVQQLRHAGLNPGLMYSGSAGAGMQGSVGTVSAPSGPSGSVLGFGNSPAGMMSALADLADIESTIKLKDSQANVYDSQAQYYDSMTEWNEIKAKLDDLEYQALNTDFQIVTTNPKTLEVKVDKTTGVMLKYFDQVERIASSRYDNDKRAVEAANWLEHFGNILSEQNAKSKYEQVQAWLADVSKRLILWVEDKHGELYSRTFKAELEAKLQYFIDRKNHDFTGSTTELITSWIDSIVGVVGNLTPGKWVKGFNSPK